MKPHNNNNNNRTHYSYLFGPNFMREPTGILDLTIAREETRRKIIHTLIRNGELLAALPKSEIPIQDMVSLREALKVQEDVKRARLDLEDPRR